MEMMISLLTLAGMGYAAFKGISWMLRAGKTQIKREEALTPRDLKVLEEAAARLMADMRATTEECVQKIETTLANAEARLSRLERVELLPIEYVEKDVVLTGEVQLIENLEKLGMALCDNNARSAQ